MPIVTLEDRAVLRFTGPDAQRLLQDVLTPDLDGLSAGDVVAGALLTPQGKIMFDFVVARDSDTGFLIDIDAAYADDFVRRMTLYRLRAKLEMARADDLHVTAIWQEERPEGALRDTRFRSTETVYRLYAPRHERVTGSAGDYVKLRIANSVAELGADYPPSDAFPHDVLMDRNGGVSFKKGCFVGQEVVSRMQHRATARRRLVQVFASQDLPAGDIDITVDDRSIGTLGSRSGSEGLAIVRIDKAGAAIAAGKAIHAGDQPVDIRLADWTGLSFPTDLQASEA
ncbi:YgfZ/GcvT domain-containing protein [Georhizobium sp. MAB10]|uniref:CAF17-like 4Fe-4S cluster assembly/insertion protein YgfZ n=1 Tax=Georhizobium sp. MAB10 TaxID=3028319 RepID=UPI003855DBF5